MADAIMGEWQRAFDVSEHMQKAAGHEHYDKRPVDLAEMTSIVSDLRRLLKWSQASFPPSSQDGAHPSAYPYVHVIGYSMGGFMAQSAFFGWPQVVCSCSNLFAGGALRDLAPTAFAHPEEWQAVLHGLRYEFDGALEGRFLQRKGKGQHAHIAGIDPSDFDYMKRIFYEVFLQYYKGGYSSRVAEFSRRLFFVVGGDDPIVRTKNVLDAGPPEGMTLLQLADVSHFPAGAAGKREDKQKAELEQRAFWLPEIGRVIAQFSERAEGALDKTLRECWSADGGSPPSGEARTTSAPRELLNVQDGLDNRIFESQLDQLLKVAGVDGWTLISRNEIPTVFLGQLGFRYHALALHHSEDLIAEYVQELQAREKRLSELVHSFTLLIPEQSRKWLIDESLRRKLFARSETPGAAYPPQRSELEAMWRHFETRWTGTGAVQYVKAGEHALQDLGDVGRAEAERLKTDKLPVTMLPDIWIGLAPEVCEHIAGAPRRRWPDGELRHNSEHAIVAWAGKLVPGDRLYESSLTKWLRDGRIIALKVSAAELNPRYRGQRLSESRAVIRALRHWAVAYEASRPISVHAEPSD